MKASSHHHSSSSSLNQRRSGFVPITAAATTTTWRRQRGAPDNKNRSRRHRNHQQTIFIALLLIGVSVWFLVPLILFKHTTLFHGGPSSTSWSTALTTREEIPVHQPMEAEVAAPPPVLSKSETQIVDMRQLNRQLPFDNPDGGVWKQGYDVLPKSYSKDEPMTIYVIPHSHCDPGWLKTFDQYFQQQTKEILTTVIQSLLKNPKRTFIWAEISYFEWWYREQSSEVQEQVKQLLQRKQLEFVTGGWVQTDEANTQLYAMQVQLEEGLDWIRETFGSQYVPKFGWSIDPFGYSPTMAFLLQKFGFQGMLIQRVHYAIKKELAQRQHLEFMWRQTWDDTGNHDIFTHLMPFYSYDAPHTCGPDPSVCCQFDFSRMLDRNLHQACPWHQQPQPITEINVHERSMLLLDQWQKKSSLYKSRVVMSPLGDDFRYGSMEEADAQYSNYEKIFQYINANVPGVTAQFGTLSDYFHAVMGTFDVPILKGSFFTYADRDQDYWSGYFTSRVFDKALDRKLERVLFAADTLGASTKELQQPRRALSLFQHHDGVTGTARNNVVLDYAKRIHTAIHQTQDWMITKILGDSNNDLQPCWQSDAPRGLAQNLCGNFSQGVTVYNPLEVPQTCGSIHVQGHSNAKVFSPCEHPGPVANKANLYQFEAGLLTYPIKESWQVWKVNRGGAYLFFPGILNKRHLIDPQVTSDGWSIDDGDWKRTLVEKRVSDEFGNSAHVLDFIFETYLQTTEEEWVVRFSADIKNDGIFHTDLNGFNFDTHYFRSDMPIQSQVFPMPTLASIQDGSMRMTIISEHAQGTASLENGAIDVWLDRRLSHDDERGLGHGVMDNVPTRTKLRLVLEYEGFNINGEFDVTPLCRRMWDELNHPLESFGKLAFESAAAVTGEVSSKTARRRYDEIKPANAANKFSKSNKLINAAHFFPKFQNRNKTLDKRALRSAKEVSYTNITVKVASIDDTSPIVPFVFMVFKRVDYLKQVIASIRASDFDRARVPLIFSHDGHVPEMMEYVETLKEEFIVMQLVHNFSCHDNPHSFPGNDPTLNIGYEGDLYKNPRTWEITCCKHHFTWMLKSVFSLDIKAEAFLFMEEDYTVGNNIYKNILTALDIITNGIDKDHLFGITLDPTDGQSRPDLGMRQDGWFVRPFVSGPMVLTRNTWAKIQTNAKDFCVVDDYNWDWSLVHLMQKRLLPSMVITSTRMLVKHIGLEGMHGKSISKIKQKKMKEYQLPQNFTGTSYYPMVGNPVVRKVTPNGGWGHPKDQSHCMEVLKGPTTKWSILSYH